MDFITNLWVRREVFVIPVWEMSKPPLGLPLDSKPPLDNLPKVHFLDRQSYFHTQSSCFVSFLCDLSSLSPQVTISLTSRHKPTHSTPSPHRSWPHYTMHCHLSYLCTYLVLLKVGQGACEALLWRSEAMVPHFVRSNVLHKHLTNWTKFNQSDKTSKEINFVYSLSNNLLLSTLTRLSKPTLRSFQHIKILYDWELKMLYIM